MSSIWWKDVFQAVHQLTETNTGSLWLKATASQNADRKYLNFKPSGLEVSLGGCHVWWWWISGQKPVRTKQPDDLVWWQLEHWTFIMLQPMKCGNTVKILQLERLPLFLTLLKRMWVFFGMGNHIEMSKLVTVDPSRII